MAIKKVKSPIQLEYEKQLRRVKQFIYRAEKRGYEFATNLIPKRPKKITEGSVRRLQKVTPDYLYSKATAKTEQGKTITGKQKRVQERIQSAKKGGHTRKRNLEKARKQREYKEEQRKKELEEKTKRDYEKAKNTAEFDRGILTYQRLQTMISDAKAKNQIGGRKVEQLLSEAIADLGFNNVMERIGNSSEDIISEAWTVITYWGRDDSKAFPAFTALVFLITGRRMTAEEAMEASDIYQANEDYTSDTYDSVETDENGYIKVDKEEGNPWD